MADWVSYWDSDNPIYVNARHRNVHYRTIADEVRSYAAAAAEDLKSQGRGPAVLDYGCGEALHAEQVAAASGRLILCDAAPNLRMALARRFAGHPKIEVRSPDDIAQMADASLDLIVLHSVLQYLKPAEADALFQMFRRLVRPAGRFVLGDVIPPDVSPLVDAMALFRFAAANGFLIAAAFGLVRTTFSSYPRLRSTLGIAQYDEAAIIDKLAKAGFSAQRTPHNIGHNQARMTFVARPV